MEQRKGKRDSATPIAAAVLPAPAGLRRGDLQSVTIVNDLTNPLYYLPGAKNATVKLTLYRFRASSTCPTISPLHPAANPSPLRRRGMRTGRGDWRSFSNNSLNFIHVSGKQQYYHWSRACPVCRRRAGQPEQCQGSRCTRSTLVERRRRCVCRQRPADCRVAASKWGHRPSRTRLGVELAGRSDRTGRALARVERSEPASEVGSLIGGNSPRATSRRSCSRSRLPSSVVTARCGAVRCRRRSRQKPRSVRRCSPTGKPSPAGWRIPPACRACRCR